MTDQEKVVAGEELGSVREAQPDQADEAAGDSAMDAGALQVLLEDARSKADSHWDQCLRLQADIDNLRKRNERDLVNAHKFALEKFAVDLLPVKDSLEMGLAAAGENADVAGLKEGSELTLKMLTSAMGKYNIKEISALNEQFNPEYHEAMSVQERADVKPNTVVTVVQKGYLLNDRLIRPAMVIVSRATQESSGGQFNEQA